jgi:hypothetical protein
MAFAQPVDSVAPADPFGAAAGENQAKPFTGVLTIRQKDGSLYYKVYFVEGRAIGGFDSWQGHSKPYHRVVGGWYDGERMTLLMQSTQNDLDDKWFSHAHHFRKEGEGFVIEQSLYGDGKTIDSGEVYQPHVLEESSALSAEETRRLAEVAEPDVSSSNGAADAETETNKNAKKAAARAERENARLKTLVAELLLENQALKRRLSEK